MSDPSKPGPKEDESFFRKVVRFVANPTKDWHELNSRLPDEPQDSAFARSELKEMIERKRRNDFVRKREFDALRRIRREGLSPEGLSALGRSSQLDDDSSPSPLLAARRAEAEVKAKIDAIEQQMEGESRSARVGRSSLRAPLSPAEAGGGSSGPPTLSPALPPAPGPMDRPFAAAATTLCPDPLGELPYTAPQPIDASHASTERAGLPGPEVLSAAESDSGADPLLDEAVIAFAGADYDSAEAALRALLAPGAEREQHLDTWLALFDLLRATGRQASFEQQAQDFAVRFGRSAPQWLSLPELVARESAARQGREVLPPATERGAPGAGAGWSAPLRMDAAAVAQLRERTLQMPLPWLLDWSHVVVVEPEGAHALVDLLRHWATQPVVMRWSGTDELLALLAEGSPSGARDVDPALWSLRFELLRLARRPDRYDELAIDYCLTYEVSPPAWSEPLGRVRLTDAAGLSLQAAASASTDLGSSLISSALLDDGQGLRAAVIVLGGQLTGDIHALLAAEQTRAGSARHIVVRCGCLIRVDFIAAGDLLNWAVQRRSEGCSVVFEDTHRLLALFFHAMGIHEHARILLRRD